MANFPALLRTLKSYRGEVQARSAKAGRNVVEILGQSEETPAGHVSRRSATLSQMIRLSCVVCGIEFCYAAMTAFVTPTLLKMGLKDAYMTTVWAISPSLGFFMVPLIGSLSDRCSLTFGRRRPFIMVMSVGILLGLLLVPNGRDLGVLLGDTYNYTYMQYNQSYAKDYNITMYNNSHYGGQQSLPDEQTFHNPWGLFFTIIGLIMLDFNCDGCQSPSRTYMLDVCNPEEQNRSLSIFTVLAGMGGTVGYILGAINWEKTHFGKNLGGHVRVVFSFVFIMYLICLVLTMTSVKEVPLKELGMTAERLQKRKCVKAGKKYTKFTNEDSLSDLEEEGKSCDLPKQVEYGSIDEDPARTLEMKQAEVMEVAKMEVLDVAAMEEVSLKTYLLSIIHMPASLRILCLTNLFSWSSLLLYSLNFTDFVGQAVYKGNPTATEGSAARSLYEEGVRWGSLSMALYSASCSCYSMVIKRLVDRLGARPVYILSQLVYSAGSLLMALTSNKVSVFILSSTGGVIYATVFNMPYFMVAHYHSTAMFSDSATEKTTAVRGLGTDVATVSSMVFVAQFLVSMTIGSLVHLSGTTAIVMYMAAILSLCGAICAYKVHYVGL